MRETEARRNGDIPCFRPSLLVFASTTTKVHSSGMQHLSFDRSISIVANRRNRVPRWDARAAALRSCRSWMVPAVCANKRAFAAPRSHQERTRLDVASRSSEE